MAIRQFFSTIRFETYICRMTTLRTLECLVALVDHGSVSGAAAALHMSQPALSHQIASLEKELGSPVVERLWRGVRVTAAGRATADEARVAIHAATQAIQIGRRVGSGGADGPSSRQDRLMHSLFGRSAAPGLAPGRR